MGTDKEWINDPALNGIAKEKLAFLEKIFAQITSVDMANQKEMLPFLLSLSKLSRENNISFDKSDVALVYSVLQKYSDKEDKAKMEKLSSYFR